MFSCQKQNENDKFAGRFWDETWPDALRYGSPRKATVRSCKEAGVLWALGRAQYQEVRGHAARNRP